LAFALSENVLTKQRSADGADPRDSLDGFLVLMLMGSHLG
jgi:hypothetical protein